MENRFNFAQNTYIPKETRELLGKKPEIENFALRLNIGAQFLPDKDGAPKAIIYKHEKGSKFSSEWELHHLPTSQTWSRISFKNMNRRQEDSAKDLLGKDAVSCNTFSQELNSRLIIGLGNASVFETGITLHHIHGFPYIPASSIKGLTRSWIVQCCFEGKEEDAIADRTFCDLFGCPSEVILEDPQGNRIKKAYTENGKMTESYPRSYYRINDPDKQGGERQGNLIFFDAFPTDAPKLKTDIMNPHYPKYYTGDDPPADYQSPVPIMFLTVEDTAFRFLIGLKPLPGMESVNVSGPIARHLGKPEGTLSILQTGELWLRKALTEHGIGAKTAVGYGFFRSSES